MAQEPSSPGSQSVKGTLEERDYVDGSFGFSVRPPAGCVLYREKQVGDADVEIARFLNVPFQWSFTIRHSKTTRPLDAQTMIDGLTAKLGAQHADLKVLKGEPARIASRDGVRYAASFKAETIEWLRQQAVISYQENEYFSLVFITPMAHRETAEPLFDKIVASFKIVRDDRTLQRIQAALTRGTRLLSQAATGEISLADKLVEDSYVRCLVDGKEIGFVRVTERLTTRDRRKGMEVREWGWLFNADVGTTHLEQAMFLSTDFSFERWENRRYVLPDGKANVTRRVQVDIENAIREDDQLGIAYMPKPNAVEKRDKLMVVEKSYAPAAWRTLFPRLVDLTKPELYAFSCYDSDRKGMVLRTMEVLGPARVSVDGQQVAAFKIEDTEGLIPPKTEMYVDHSGKLLRVVADHLEMVAASAQYVDQHYAKKVTEAQDLVRKLQPPAPATPKLPGERSGSSGGRSGQSGVQTAPPTGR